METRMVPQTTDVVILCGGKGTRLGHLTQDTPKPLLDIGGQPFLSHLLIRLREEGFQNCILAVHYLADQFHAFVKTHDEVFPCIQIIIENVPLGTGGALKNAAGHVRSKHFVVLNGDAFVAQPVLPVLAYHADGGNMFTMVAVKAENVEGVVYDKGGLELGEHNEILHFGGHRHVNEQWINAGLYVANTEKIISWPDGCYDLEKEFSSLLNPGEGKVFRSDARILDIGRPESLKLAKEKYAAYSLSSC